MCPTVRPPHQGQTEKPVYSIGRLDVPHVWDIWGGFISLTCTLDISTALMRPKRPKQYCLGKFLPRRSRGKYSPVFTSPETNNCFSVIFSCEYQESAIKRAKTR